MANSLKAEFHEVKDMKNIIFANGRNTYDFFLLPTIRYNASVEYIFLTIEWLKWYIGIKWWQ